MSALIDDGIAMIDAWLKANACGDIRLGLLSCANGQAVRRIRKGTATLKTFEQVIEYVQKNKKAR